MPTITAGLSDRLCRPLRDPGPPAEKDAATAELQRRGLLYQPDQLAANAKERRRRVNGFDERESRVWA